MTNTTETTVTRDDAIAFLEVACRNWSKVPKLSEEDIGDVAMALLQFQTRRSPPVVEEAAKAEPRVRDLEWEHFTESSTQYERWRALSLIGDYRIHDTGNGFEWIAPRNSGIADTLDQAQAAAQADFNARILSALSSGGAS